MPPPAPFGADITGARGGDGGVIKIFEIGVDDEDNWANLEGTISIAML